MKTTIAELDEVFHLGNGFFIFKDDEKYYLGITLYQKIEDRMKIDKNTYDFLIRREGLNKSENKKDKESRLTKAWRCACDNFS